MPYSVFLKKTTERALQNLSEYRNNPENSHTCKFLKFQALTNSADPDQTIPMGDSSKFQN